MKEQVWFKARVISSHGRHSFVEKEDGTVLEATRKGKKVDLAVGDIVDCLQTSAEQVSIQKIEPRRSLLYRSDELRTKPLASNIDQVAVVFAIPPFLQSSFHLEGHAGGGNRRHSHSDDSEQDGLYRRRAGSPTVH